MGRLAGHIQFDFAAALALHHQAVGGTARLQVQRHVMFPGQFFHQRARTVRAGFLVRVQQQRDLAVSSETGIPQHLQRGQRDHDAALVVHDAGAIGAPRLDAERPRRGGAVREHRVHVRHQQDAPLAFAGQRGLDVAALRRRGGRRLHLRAQLAQFFDGNGAHLVQSLAVEGARVNIDQPLQQRQRGRLRLLGTRVQGLVHLRRPRPAKCTRQRHAYRRQHPSLRHPNKLPHHVSQWKY
jgi:hypothetical protein